MKTQKSKILIVDDDPYIRQLVSVNIESAGYETAVVTSGKEALDEIQRNPPDLMILDVMMPELDGWEICKIIRDNCNLKNLKIVILTAKDAEKDKMIGKHILGADEYITKPFDIDALLFTIRNLLKKE
jgi:DNA-binding response OmpR family regulator